MGRRCEDILERVEAYNPGADLSMLRRAYVFSAREHRSQVRRSGEPYLVHPLEVGYILAEMRLDTASIVAGLPSRRPRGHADDPRERRRPFRRRRRAHRGRGHEDLQTPVFEPPRGRGGESALIGFMGTGKSSVGRLVARNLGFDFLDTDHLIEERSGKKVLPHENTLLAPKMDRLSLMREVKANLSPIFILYDDDRHAICKVLKKVAAEKKPFIDVVFEGARNRAWRMDDPADIATVQRIMADADTFIADGHHRFEVSRMYSAEAGTEGSRYVMVYFVESDERMLTVLPA